MLYVFTSAAANYSPKVKMLFNSLRKYHPEWKLYYVLADDVKESLDPKEFMADEIVKISDLSIPKWKSWAFSHSLVELSTGLKPFMLKILLNKNDCEAVLYFDPDMVLFSRLDDLVAEFKQNSILLTPHQTKPEQTMEAVIDNEICSLRHGIYNLGFIGVKKDVQGKSFSEWWADRIYHFCVSDFNRGIFVDQKWIDFVPVFFDDVKILKSPRFNVATWNLTTRKFTQNSKKEFLVDGQPLGFYHFTGFDSGAHELMANKYAGGNSAVKDLIHWYKESTKVSDGTSLPKWAFSSFDNGEKITDLHRLIYRSRKDLQDKFPDPFKVIKDDQCYNNWFRWRAAIEYPELMIASGNSGAAPLPQLAIPSEIKKRPTIWKYLKMSVMNYHDGLRLIKRASFILIHEGFKGLKRRIR